MKNWFMKENSFPFYIPVSIRNFITIWIIILSCIPVIIWGQGEQAPIHDPSKLLTINVNQPIALKGETLMDLVVEDRKTIASNSFILYQNDPNPFREETMVAFELYKKTALTLTIYDPKGKVLKEYEGTFGKGKNTIQVDGKDLNQYGILYYQMTTPTQILSKKMIFKKPSKT